MKDGIRLRFFDDEARDLEPRELRGEEQQPITQVLDIVEPAINCAGHLPVRMAEQKLSQVTADKSGYTRDQSTQVNASAARASQAREKRHALVLKQTRCDYTAGEREKRNASEQAQTNDRSELRAPLLRPPAPGAPGSL